MSLTQQCQHVSHHAHSVHYYQDDRFLAGALQEFIRLGIERNEGIVLIVTDKHAEMIKKELPLHKPLQIVIVDANLVLTKIMTNDFINKNKFHEFVRTIVVEMRSRYKTVRFFGEIVDVLCSMGMPQEAVELEGYWNEFLASEPNLSLMCGYSNKNAKAHNMGERLTKTHSFVISQVRDESKEIDVLYAKIASMEMRFADMKMNEKNVERIEQEVAILKSHITHSTKLSLLGEMTTNLAHELLNPLTIIGSYTSVLKSVIKDENFAAKDFTTKQVDGIDKTVHRMTDLMKNILMLASTGTPKFSDYSVSQSLLTGIELMNPHLKSKKIRLVHNALPGNLQSFGDSGQMIQIILNMLANSRDAIEEAHGIRGGVITITEKATDQNIEIQIDDNGIGMKKNVMENIFKTFYTTKPFGKGTGLGLAIVKKTLKEFNGSITCSSMYQQGTQFTILIPKKQIKVFKEIPAAQSLSHF